MSLNFKLMRYDNVVLSALLFFGLCASSAIAKVRGTWEPTKVNISLPAGATVIVHVFFDIDRDTSDVLVRIGPELEGYIETQTELGDITAGQGIVLQLAISAPLFPPLTPVEGTVILRSGSKPNAAIARPLPISISFGAAEFSQPEGTYAIEIPPELASQYFAPDDVLVLKSPEDTQDNSESPSIVISTESNPLNLSIEDFFDGDPGDDLVGHSDGELSDLTVDGWPAVQFVPFITLAGNVIVVVAVNDRFVIINDAGSSHQEDGVFEDVLNSVRIIQ